MYALRLLRRRLGITIAIVLTLAVAIGANTAVFSIVDAVLFGRLPVRDPDRVVALFTLDSKNPGYLPVSDLNRRDLGKMVDDTMEVGTFAFIGANVGEGDDVQPAGGLLVTANYFSLLGVEPALGRAFDHDDDELGAHSEIVLAHDWWQERFAGDPTIVGRTLRLDEKPVTVIGIAPRGFIGTTLLRPQFYVPYSSHREVMPQDEPWFGSRRWLVFSPIARLRPGVSLEQANDALAAAGSQLAAMYPDDNGTRTFTAIPATHAMFGADAREDLVAASTLLMTMAAFVLVIACANAANLMLARAATRRSEIAIRAVLGARPMRLVRQLLTESLVLAAIAATVGVLLAFVIRDFVWELRPPGLELPGIEPTIDGRVLGFAVLITAITGVAFGLAPAIRAARIDLTTPMRGTAAPGVVGRIGLRGGLVIVQVALSMIALVGAGLFIRSMANIRRVDPGFAAEQLVIANVDLGGGGDPEAQVVQRSELLQALRAAPGVRDAELAQRVPFGGAQMRRTVFVEGRDIPDAEDGVLFDVDPAGPRFFDTLGMRLVAGRPFSVDDRLERPRVAIVNEAFARRFWGTRDPLGERIRFLGEEKLLEIVGVVSNHKNAALTEAPTPTVFMPLEQWPLPDVMLAVRVDDPATAAAGIEVALAGMPDAPRVGGVQPYTEVIEGALFAPRLGATLLGTFGALALLLAAVGLHGVMAYNVRLRTREIGIRMALGARSEHVFRRILGDAMVLVIAGVGVGLVGGIVLEALLKDLLYEVPLGDPLAFGGAAVVLVMLAGLAAWLPAREATRVDPMVAMRHA
jgi:predicted permease